MAKRKPDPKRYCRYCKARLRRKAFANGRLEDLSIFRRRKFCDQLCMAQGMVQKGDVSRAQYYHRARKFKKDCCERCGAMSDLEIHHKDDDYKNNDPDNLETLCGKCHDKHHGEKRGNTFAGRQWLLKTDLGEIWAALRDSMRSASPQLTKRIEAILHKHGQL